VWTLLPSPIGELLLVGDGAALTSVWFPSGDGAPADPPLGPARATTTTPC
jgi:hypothetical protein